MLLIQMMAIRISCLFQNISPQMSTLNAKDESMLKIDDIKRNRIIDAVMAAGKDDENGKDIEEND